MSELRQSRRVPGCDGAAADMELRQRRQAGDVTQHPVVDAGAGQLQRRQQAQGADRGPVLLQQPAVVQFEVPQQGECRQCRHARHLLTSQQSCSLLCAACAVIETSPDMCAHEEMTLSQLVWNVKHGSRCSGANGSSR